MRRCPSQVRAHDDVSTAAPGGAELEIGAVTAVELPPVCECSEAQGSARIHEVLQLIAGPPVAGGRDRNSREDLERIGRSVHQPLEIDFEVVAVVEISAEHAPLEP